MRTVFMGSPEFAVPSLLALHAQTEVVAVVCQPDKPAGRGLDMTPPSVKVQAQTLGLTVLQPQYVRPSKSDFCQQLAALAPEREAARAAFFARGQACLRASPLGSSATIRPS